MEKAERFMVEPVSGLDFRQSKTEVSDGFSKFQYLLVKFFIKKGYILFFIGLLLGRALILDSLTLFILPFFAAVYLIKRQLAPIALLGLVVGATTLSFTNAVYTFATIFLFLILFKLTKKFFDSEEQSIPYYVFSTIFMIGLVKEYYLTRDLAISDGIIVGIEAGLGFILTLIFLQCIPLILAHNRKQTLRTEEIVSLVILLSSILTGTIGWVVGVAAVDHILARYFVLIFAFSAGATFGATVGVVTGLIFSLANISTFDHLVLLAFTGLLGGLLKEGRKLGVSVGLIISTLLIVIYSGESGMPLVSTLVESAVAILLFFLTPQILVSQISKYIPGTVENSNEQFQYMKKLRDVTAERVEKFAYVFKALSESFSTLNNLTEEEEEDYDLIDLLGEVYFKSCNVCYKRDYCWNIEEEEKTEGLLRHIVLDMDKYNGKVTTSILKEWDMHCVKSKKVTDLIKEKLPHYQAKVKLKRQIVESRRLVADQLMGVAMVMEDFAEEIKKEQENHYKQEEQIIEALQEFGIHIEDIEIYSLEKGNIDIDIIIPYCRGHGECEKIIAPMLSDILDETIIVDQEQCAHQSGGYCHATFRSAKAFRVETGVAFAAKGGGMISGDNYTTVDLSGGKHAVAISDGMGNGERAYLESKATLELLQRILQSGIDEKIAIKSVNSILTLRTTDEIFATLDLALIDLQNAEVKFLKVGSAPSFIRRGGKVQKIQANNLPIGILHDFEVEAVNGQLKAGDILIMMSDGIFEGPTFVENYDFWLKRKISEIETDDPQEIADIIIDEVIRTRGSIDDDMTVVVTKIEHNTPKWATIPVSKLKKKAQ